MLKGLSPCECRMVACFLIKEKVQPPVLVININLNSVWRMYLRVSGAACLVVGAASSKIAALKRYCSQHSDTVYIAIPVIFLVEPSCCDKFRNGEVLQACISVCLHLRLSMSRHTCSS